VVDCTKIGVIWRPYILPEMCCIAYCCLRNWSVVLSDVYDVSVDTPHVVCRMTVLTDSKMYT
jgi:hypothetical protein